MIIFTEIVDALTTLAILSGNDYVENVVGYGILTNRAWLEEAGDFPIETLIQNYCLHVNCPATHFENAFQVFENFVEEPETFPDRQVDRSPWVSIYNDYLALQERKR